MTPPPSSPRLEMLMQLLMRARDCAAWKTYDEINGKIKAEVARLKENAA